MSKPYFNFFPADWMADPALRRCSPDERGVWMDMLCLMHEGNPYGTLTLPNGEEIDEKSLGKMLQIHGNSLRKILKNLEKNGVFCRENGVIFSKRMVADEAKRQEWRGQKAKQKTSVSADFPQDSDERKTPVFRPYPLPLPLPFPSKDIDKTSSSSDHGEGDDKNISVQKVPGRFTQGKQFFQIKRNGVPSSEVDWILSCLHQEQKRFNTGLDLDDFLELYPYAQKTYNRWMKHPIHVRMSAFAKVLTETNAKNELTYALHLADKSQSDLNVLADHLEVFGPAVESGDMEVSFNG